MNNTIKYLNNLKELELHHLLMLLLETENEKNLISNIKFIKHQVEEFNIMFPELWRLEDEKKNE